MACKASCKCAADNLIGRTIDNISQVYTEWSERHGDAATFFWNVIGFDSNISLQIDVEHKRRDAIDSSSATAASFSAIGSTGVKSVRATGLKELVRCKLTWPIPEPVDDEPPIIVQPGWVHLDMLSPCWETNEASEAEVFVHPSADALGFGFRGEMTSSCGCGGACGCGNTGGSEGGGSWDGGNGGGSTTTIDDPTTWRGGATTTTSVPHTAGTIDTNMLGASIGSDGFGGLVKDPGECPCMELYAQAKTACTTGVGDPCWRAVHYYMLCKNDHPECPDLKVPRWDSEIRCGADVTKHLVSLMKDAYKNLTTNPTWLHYYYMMLKPGGTWDWKLDSWKPAEWLCEVGCPHTLALCGICFNDSVPANMLLGYVLAEAGWSRKEIVRLITWLVSPKEWPQYDRTAFDIGMFLSSRFLNNLGDWTGPTGTDAIDTICKMVKAFQSSLQAPDNKECASATPCASF